MKVRRKMGCHHYDVGSWRSIFCGKYPHFLCLHTRAFQAKSTGKLIFRQSDRMAATHQLKARDLFSVKGYVCVVTGGGTGIGLMATQALTANGTLAGKK